MALIPFVPGALAGALIWRQNCDSDVGAIGCIPPAPEGNDDWVGFCSKSDLAVNLTVEVDEIAGINSCVRVPPEREVTGAVGTITGCRVNDGALLQLIAAASPVVWDDPANPAPAPIVADDEVGYKMEEFGSVGCQTCGGGCDYFSGILWMCALSIRGCTTALPRGVYAVVALPSFKLSQPKDMAFGGARADLEDKLDFEIDIFDLNGNTAWYPCVSPDVPEAQRGPIFELAGPNIMPDVLGMEGSPLAVFLTDVAPPVNCDCCGEAGFWSGITDGTTPGTLPVGFDGNAPAEFIDAEAGQAILAALSNDVDTDRFVGVVADLEAEVASTTPAQRKAKLDARAAAEKAG